MFSTSKQQKTAWVAIGRGKIKNGFCSTVAFQTALVWVAYTAKNGHSFVFMLCVVCMCVCAISLIYARNAAKLSILANV